MHQYFRKNVEIRAKGLIYRGFLVGADEVTIYLKGPTGWITLLLDEVAAVRLEGAGEEGWNRKGVEGEEEVPPADRTSKIFYSKRDIEKIHEGLATGDWPEGDEPDESKTD